MTSRAYRREGKERARKHPLIPPQFPSRVIAPLLAGDVDTVTDYVTEILAVTGPSWAVKNRRPRSSGSQSPPDDASIQELPRTTLAPLPSWVDDLHARISQLAVLIHDAQDLARSPSGWIKTSALIAYNGPSIPGNFDTHSGEIVNTSTFLLKVHGLSQPLTDECIKGLVSKDDLRGPKRFILGLYAPRKRTNSTQLVIRLTPIPAADPNAGAAGASSPRTSRPLTLDEAEPFGVYFFQSSMLRVLTREGIRPSNVNPSPPDEHIVRWLRAQAPRLAQRDEGDKSAIPLGLYVFFFLLVSRTRHHSCAGHCIPLGLYAFFCGNISLPQVVELIKARHSNDEKSVQLMRNQFRNNKVELRIPRLPHPLHAVLTQQALASGVQPPPTPAAPHIAPLPEGFALDPPVTSQLHQPASARGQAPKRPAPETPASVKTT